MAVDPVDTELERLETRDIMQPAHLIIQQLLLKNFDYIHKRNWAKAYRATEKLKAEVYKYLGMRGVSNISKFECDFLALMRMYHYTTFTNQSMKEESCHEDLCKLVIMMSESGFDFIVIMERIKTQDDVKRAIKGILESLSAIDPYFEAYKDIGTAEVVKQGLRKLNDLLAMFETDDENIKDIVDAARIAIKNYDRILSTVIVGGIGELRKSGVLDLDYSDKGGVKSKVHKDYLTVKQGFSEILSIFEIVLEKPERAERLWKDIEEMAKGTEKSALPFDIHITPRG